MQRIALLSVAACLLLVSTALAQDYIPPEILNRTLLIKAGGEYGTAFTLDYQGELYIVTARHVVAGLPQSRATIRVLKSGQWLDVHTVKTLFPASSDVDIAVFQTGEKISQPYEITPSRKGEFPMMGQQVWFLGYPWGIHSHFENNTEAPFIKRGTLSAIDASTPNAEVLYIDGFNNPGFSGGPIVYWNFDKRAYRIMGVVQGYKEDTAKVLVNGQHVDTRLLVNSGILVGYGIEHAIQTIEQSKQQQP